MKVFIKIHTRLCSKAMLMNRGNVRKYTVVLWTLQTLQTLTEVVLNSDKKTTNTTTDQFCSLWQKILLVSKQKCYL